MATLQHVKIYPSIGIARIGNSPEWYIGPEIPFPQPFPVPSDGNYKDSQCRIRRQAQRFRLFGFYDDASVAELTQADGDITWTVHVANAKATKPQYNEGLVIDPGPRTISGPNASATFANGTYQGVEVPLGEMQTDDSGRLIVIGGFGFSSSPTNQPVNSYLDNAGWHDDVSDGPVDASIVVGGTTYTAEGGAWVICPPPRFAPQVQSVTTLYDTLRQIAIDNSQLPSPGTAGYPAVSFVNDIWPFLLRGINAMRVSAAAFGPGDHATLKNLIPPPGTASDRQTVLNKLKPPGQGASGSKDMPLLYGSSAIQPFQYYNVQQWAAGTFTNDWGAGPVAPSLTADGMTRAALENCVGAAFFPGIEATSTVSSFPYVEPFRFDHSGMTPGSVTQMMARPWQADFTACSGGTTSDEPSWWPAARPDSVFPESTPTTPADWTRDLITGYDDMVANWFRLGFVVDTGGGTLLETERHVVCKDCFVITDRSEFGQDEIAAMIALGGTPATIDAAFYVVVEGFQPGELGITTATPNAMQLQMWAPTISFAPAITDLSAACTGLLVQDPSLPATPQRFTFVYAMQFASTAGFTMELEPVTLTASLTAQSVSAGATIQLTQQPNPYLTDGPISWLSTDLRVFQMTPAQVTQYLPTGSWTDPNTFISDVIDRFRSITTAPPLHPFDSISIDENVSHLELSTLVNGTPVYNFAMCRVRYRALATPAPDVRVFFRLFQTASTGTSFDIGSSYRRGGLTGTTIPLLGIQGGELVTIPCFAAPRVNAATQLLTAQTDTKNVLTIAPDATGNEVESYFGCWLDINQPTLQFPLQPTPPDGPFTSGQQSIQNLIRGYHQCLVAEIAFDPDPIPSGSTPAASDKLAQRNLAIVESANPGDPATHRIQHTFQIRPTRATLQRTEKPDELMIDWGNTPVGSTATLYLPAVNAGDILGYAGRMYETSLLRRVDDHTVSTTTAGVTYVPIPPGTSPGIAGLLSVDLPASVRHGELFKIVVRQVTTEQVTVRAPVPRAAPPAATRGTARARSQSTSGLNFSLIAASAFKPVKNQRRILGSFQISVPVAHQELILPIEERRLATLSSILRTIPVEDRWYFPFKRYVDEVAQRVRGLGGGHGRDHDHDHEHGGGHEEHLRSFTGKIEGLVYDRFGDFEGFLLRVGEHEHVFRSREADLEQVARFAWADRVLVTVFVEREKEHVPVSIILRATP